MMLAELLVWPSPGPEIRGESYPQPGSQESRLPGPGSRLGRALWLRALGPNTGSGHESIRVGHFISIL